MLTARVLEPKKHNYEKLISLLKRLHDRQKDYRSPKATCQLPPSLTYPCISPEVKRLGKQHISTDTMLPVPNMGAIFIA